jgi:hypothetical protein
MASFGSEKFNHGLGLRRRRQVSLSSEDSAPQLSASVCGGEAVAIEDLDRERVELAIMFRNDADLVLVTQRRSNLPINGDEIIHGFGKVSAPAGHCCHGLQGRIRFREAERISGIWGGNTRGRGCSPRVSCWLCFFLGRMAQRAAQSDRENYGILGAKFLRECVPMRRR